MRLQEMQWHTAVLKQEARVLIVENKDTGSENSNSCTLTENDKNIMKSIYK